MHVRRRLARVVTVALAASALPLLVAGAGPAVASDGDVLTVERTTPTASVSRSSTSATFVAHGADDSRGPSGASFRIDYVDGVTLAPPSGARFVAGRSYPAAATATATAAMLRPDTPGFRGTICPGFNAGQPSGTVRVLAAAYDEHGLLTELAADYTGTCTADHDYLDQTISGSVRHVSARPWSNLRSHYVDDVVPLGRERVQDVTITATAGGGKTVTLGAASLTGNRAADYRVADNGCSNAVLGHGDSCRVAVVFQPQTYSNDPSERIAMLVVAASEHVGDAIRVRLESRRTNLPTTPRHLSTYPTAGGLGLSWSEGDRGGHQYLVERRRAGEPFWTAVATRSESELLSYVDHDVRPGEQASYRVTPSNWGWDGDAATTTGTRANDLPTVQDQLMMHLDHEVAGTPRHVRITSGDPGSTVDVGGGQRPGIFARQGEAGSGAAISYQAFPVPGPGAYRGDAAGLVFTNDGHSCTFSDRVLVVRRVLYDETRAPVVLDASWAGVCDGDQVVRLEIRLGSDSADSEVTTDPTAVDRLTTFGGGSADVGITISNSGAAPVALGDATTRGPGAIDWRAADNACNGRTLSPGASCSVTMAFRSTADRERPAVLEVARTDAGGRLAPVVVPLDGFGATPPPTPVGYGTGSLRAVLLQWEATGDGGLPIQSFEVERRHDGSGWSRIATVPVSARPSWIDRVPPRVVGPFDYRVRAVNAAGSSDWQTDRFTRMGLADRAVVVSGRTGLAGPRGLFQLTHGPTDLPVIPLTDDPAHDYRTAAVSPGGTRLAVSVSTGDGSDGEYDLWTGTLERPRSTHVTTMAGAERDPAYSPDTSQVAFTHVTSGGRRSVWIVPAAGGTPRLVREDASQPVWERDGTRLIVEDDSTSTAPLLHIDPATGAVTAVVPDSAGGRQPSLGPDGTLAWIAPDGSVRTLADGAGSSAPAGPPRGVIVGNPAFTDDGRLTWESARESGGVESMTKLLKGVVEPAPVREDLSAPGLNIHAPTTIVPGAVTWTVSVSDDATPSAALRPECRVDDGPWRGCRGGGSADHLSDGTHRIEARLVDEAGRLQNATTGIISDAHPPTLTMSTPTVAQAAGGTLTFGWTGRDGAPGTPVYDVTMAIARPTSPLTAYRRPAGWSSADARTALVVRPAQGQETCVRVRARDVAGMWSTPVVRCVARPLDDRGLRVSQGWKRVAGAGRYQSTESVATRKGVTTQTSGRVTARRIGIMATTCARCGAVQVHVQGRLLGTVSLVSARTARQQVRYVALPTSEVTGVIRLRTMSARSVAIDGLLLARH